MNERVLEPIRVRYQNVLNAFLKRVQQDHTIIAAILYGSLAYDDVWEQSDIDILLVCQDGIAGKQSVVLLEDDIPIHISMGSRSQFKMLMERSFHGSFMHSAFSKSVLLFCRDEAIQHSYQAIQRGGSLDREMQMLQALGRVLPCLSKAEKWLFVKHDPLYSFQWLLLLIEDLATIEVLWHAEIASREVLQQASRYNPALFGTIYSELMQLPKDEANIQHALTLIHAYLDEKGEVLCRPILAYLAQEGGARSVSEIDFYLQQRASLGSLAEVYEWLAQLGSVEKVSLPVKLTLKSRVAFEEAAYYYAGPEVEMAVDDRENLQEPEEIEAYATSDDQREKGA